MATRRITGAKKKLRKVPPNNPGGIAFGITVVRDINAWTDADVNLAVGLPDPTLTPDGIVSVDVKGGFFQNNGRWAVYNGGVNILATVAITEGTSLIRLAYLSPPTGDTWVIIPAFSQELVSLTGLVCAGAIIYHSYP